MCFVSYYIKGFHVLYRLIIDHEADQENNDSKPRGLTETEQCPRKGQKNGRPTQLQCKMSKVYNVKKDSSNMTESKQTGMKTENLKK